MTYHGGAVKYYTCQRMQVVLDWSETSRIHGGPMEQSGAATPQREATTVGAYDAKTNLPRLLERVSKGERITITRHGVPVAVLVPAAASEQPDVRAAVEEMKRFRKGRSLKNLNIREMIEEGRRF